jgi:hypothetical protein
MAVPVPLGYVQSPEANAVALADGDGLGVVGVAAGDAAVAEGLVIAPESGTRPQAVITPTVATKQQAVAARRTTAARSSVPVTT